MDEAGQESGVLIFFQQLVKAFRMEKTNEKQKKKKEKERKEERKEQRDPLTRCMEAGVKDHMRLKKQA